MNTDQVNAGNNTPPYNRQITSTKPNHSKAHARVSVYGLSIECLSRFQDAVEIAFLKEMHYSPTIHVFDGDCMPVALPTLPSVPFRIEINKTNPIGPGAFFNDGTNDDENYKWMPDIESWHGRPVRIKANADKFSAKLVLKDGVYYTRLRAYNNAVRMDSDGGIQIIQGLGRLFGADIECDAADEGIEIKIIGSDVKSISLPKMSSPYEICIGATPHHNGDHLPMIFDDIIDTPENKRSSLRFAAEEKPWSICSLQERTKMVTTEFACQSYGGGGGPLPDIP